MTDRELSSVSAASTEEALERFADQLLDVWVQAPASTLDAVVAALADFIGVEDLVLAVQETETRRVKVSLRHGMPLPLVRAGGQETLAADSERLRRAYRAIDLGDGQHRVLLGGVPADVAQAHSLVVERLARSVGRVALAVRERERRPDPAMVLGVLDGLPIGVVVVRRDTEVVFANRSARRLLEGELSPLFEHEGQLRAADGDANRRLADLIREASGARLEVRPIDGAIQFDRPSGRPISAVVSPIGVSLGFQLARQDLALILVSDPDHGASAIDEVLRAQYGLTPSESRVAVKLAQGVSLEQLTEDLHISLNTAKTHLKSIFAKMGSSRQSELIAAILSGPAGLMMH